MPRSRIVNVETIRRLAARLRDGPPPRSHTQVGLLLAGKAADAPYRERQAASARLSRALSGAEHVSTYRYAAWMQEALYAGAEVEDLTPHDSSRGNT